MGARGGSTGQAGRGSYEQPASRWSIATCPSVGSLAFVTSGRFEGHAPITPHMRPQVAHASSSNADGGSSLCSRGGETRNSRDGDVATGNLPASSGPETGRTREAATKGNPVAAPRPMPSFGVPWRETYVQLERRTDYMISSPSRKRSEFLRETRATPQCTLCATCSRHGVISPAGPRNAPFRVNRGLLGAAHAGRIPCSRRDARHRETPSVSRCSPAPDRP